MAAVKARCSVALSAAVMDENLVDMTVTSRVALMVGRSGTSTVARMVEGMGLPMVAAMGVHLVASRADMKAFLKVDYWAALTVGWMAAKKVSVRAYLLVCL